MSTVLAHGSPPAGGASAEEVIVASLVGLILLVAAGALVIAYRRGRLEALDRVAALVGRLSGLPPWAALPLIVGGISLVIAVFGFYWDVATHIDHGRDAGVFANPSHWWILVGLIGIAGAGVLSVLLGGGRQRRIPVGGGLLLLCGAIALAGFPIDDVWHRIFGQDVTLWSPPHIQMVMGASLCTLALWALLVEVERSAPHVRRGWRFRFGDVALAGALLLGMSTMQGEFDYGVPQFRLLYQPLLIAIAAGIALVPARIRLGRGGALIAVGFFLAVRGALTLVVSGVFEHITFHAPLYLGAAIVVELVAARVPSDRQLSFGAWAGLGIGTLGIAVEWAWSQVWMPIPWSAALLPEVLLVVPAAVAAGLVGGFIGRALAPPGMAQQAVPAAIAPVAAVALVAVLLYPLPTRGVDADVAISLEEATPGHAHATFVFERPEVAADAEWLMVLAWQGAEWWTEESAIVDHLEQVDAATYRTTRPIPVDGEWKSLLRLHSGRVMAAVPIFLPEDLAIPAEEVPAESQVTRRFTADRDLLLREARPAPPWTTGLAYTLMALIGAAWIGAFVWGLRRMRLTAATVPDRDDDASVDPDRSRAPPP